MDDIEEVFDDAADQAAEQLNNVSEQVQSAAQGAIDSASNFADSLQSELLPCFSKLCHVGVLYILRCVMHLCSTCKKSPDPQHCSCALMGSVTHVAQGPTAELSRFNKSLGGLHSYS